MPDYSCYHHWLYLSCLIFLYFIKMNKEKVLMFWSGGKDSAMALHEILKSERYEVEALITTINKKYLRVSMHGIREELVDEQAKEIGGGRLGESPMDHGRMRQACGAGGDGAPGGPAACGTCWLRPTPGALRRRSTSVPPSTHPPGWMSFARSSGQAGSIGT